VQPLDSLDGRALGETLPDHPFTFGARCLLMRGLARAWVRGSLPRFEAAVLQAPWVPNEPIALGTDPEGIWSLLREIPGWDSVNLSFDLAGPLRAILERELGVPARIYDDVYFLLDRDPIPHHHPAVRRLTEDDVDLVDRAPPALRTTGYTSTVAALTGGVAAGGIADGNLVALISMSTSSERYADIGGHTLEPWRNQGMGSAAAFLVAREVQSRGFTPVWSTGEDNYRSQRVAQKVGFREFGREAYVIVPTLQRSGGFRPSNSTPAEPAQRSREVSRGGQERSPEP
jgi:hypothetical protein